MVSRRFEGRSSGLSTETRALGKIMSDSRERRSDQGSVDRGSEELRLDVWNYAPAKAEFIIISMSRIWGVEGAPRGIRLNVVAPSHF